MKQFFKYFLACLFAITAFIFLGVFILFIIGLTSGDGKPKISENSLLVWDLSKAITDREVSSDPLAALNGNSNNQSISLRSIMRSLENAKTDDKIKGIYLKLNNCEEGWATLQELKPYLDDFKTSGKFVYGYGDAINNKAMYLSGNTVKLYTHPLGGVDWRGLSASSMFLKNMLSKLDIQPQVFYDGKYKGASEQFRLDKFSEENRFQIKEFVGDFYRELLQTVSKRTGTDTATLHQYANNYALKTAEDALKLKFIDGIKYETDVLNEIKKNLKIEDDEELNKVSIQTYASSLPEEKYNKEKIAVLYAEGQIEDGKNEEVVSTESMLKEIKKIAGNDKIKALVLRVNSPGGSALASETIYHELKELRKKMPIVISMGDVAASGGYYLSCAGDSIFAQANTITGSIGVVGMILNLKGFLNNKLGITTDVVNTAQFADMPNTSRPLTDIEKNIIQGGVDSIYSIFKSRVANARKMDMNKVQELAQGRVYSGQDAKAVGLVDEIGGLDRAIQAAAKMAKLTKYKLNEYPEPQNKLQLLISSLTGAEEEDVIVQKVLGDDYTTFKKIKSVRENMNKAMLIMPYDFKVE